MIRRTFLSRLLGVVAGVVGLGKAKAEGPAHKLTFGKAFACRKGAFVIGCDPASPGEDRTNIQVQPWPWPDAASEKQPFRLTGGKWLRVAWEEVKAGDTIIIVGIDAMEFWCALAGVVTANEPANRSIYLQEKKDLLGMSMPWAGNLKERP